MGVDDAAAVAAASEGLGLEALRAEWRTRCGARRLCAGAAGDDVGLAEPGWG
jgi:hypothetical protein